MSPTFETVQVQCVDCKRPLDEHEMELHGALCEDCQQYRYDMKKSMQAQFGEGQPDD